MGNMAFFPAYYSYRRTLAGLSAEQIGHVFMAALQYSEEGTVPELDPLEMMGFAFIKEDIDRAREHYETVCERRREAIKKRWDKRDDDSNDTKEYISIEKNTIDSIAKEKAIEKEKAKANIYDAATAADTAPKRRTKFSPPSKFYPPSVDEVAAYCAENGFDTINPEAFVDYYEARGWKIGSQSMKDWRATVRNWARRDAERQTQAAELDRDPMLAYLDKVIAGEA